MRRIIIGLMFALLVAGCGNRSAPVAPAPAGPAPAPVTAEPVPAPRPQPGPEQVVVAPVDQPVGGDPLPPELALLSLESPDRLTPFALQDQLTKYLNVGDVAPDARLQELIDKWYQDWKPRVLRGNLRADGQLEYVVAFRLFGEGRPVNGSGALFVIWRSAGRWKVDRSPGDAVPGVMLYDLADLTGDGRPEIIWGSAEAGAHTAFYDVFVSNWAPGRLEPLPGKLHMASMQLRRDGRDLLLTGGLIGSVGAGAQREWTDRYRWVDGRFQLVDRRYQPGEDWGYWRLIDGVTFEHFGHLAEAEQAYREAMDPSRPAAAADAVKPDQTGRFPAAVGTWARVRLATLQMRTGRAPDVDLANVEGPFADLAHAVLLSSSTTGACQMAASRAVGLVDALNGLYGYANGIWTPEKLCDLVP